MKIFESFFSKRRQRPFVKNNLVNIVFLDPTEKSLKVTAKSKMAKQPIFFYFQTIFNGMTSKQEE